MTNAGIRLRVGIVGAGSAARRHCDRLRDRDDVEIVAVCDLAADRAGELAARAGAEAHTSVERVLRACALDAVWVCVPPRVHGALELRLIEAGCAVWIEPPLALSARTANALGAAFKRTGVPVCVGSPWRYSVAFERARRLLGGKGAPVPALINGFWSEAEPATAWRRDEKTGGSLWLEGAWPLVDAAQALCGVPKRMSARGALHSAHPDAKARDVGAMWAEFPTGALGSFAAARVGPSATRLEIVTAQGIARLEGLHTSQVAFTWETEGETLRVAPAEDALKLAHDAFLRAVAQGKRFDLRASYADAHKTLTWALAATRAMNSSKPIVLTEK